MDILFLDVMAFGIARKEKGQSAVPCYVAGSAKAVLKSKNSKHLYPKRKEYFGSREIKNQAFL